MITAEEARKLVKESKKDNYEILLDYIYEDITERAKDGYEETAFTISNGLFHLGPGRMLFFDDYKEVLIALEKDLRKNGFKVSSYTIDDYEEKLFVRAWVPTEYVMIKWEISLDEYSKI